MALRVSSQPCQLARHRRSVISTSRHAGRKMSVAPELRPLDDEREAVPRPDYDRVTGGRSLVAAGMPGLTAKPHLAGRLARGDDRCAPADQGLRTDPLAMTAHRPVPECELAEEQRETCEQSDDVPRRRQEEDENQPDQDEHRPKATSVTYVLWARVRKRRQAKMARGLLRPTARKRSSTLKTGLHPVLQAA